MQRDMHYYAIFYLALSAGIDQEKAHIIAYSSQFVDDSREYRQINLVDHNNVSGVFDPICTQHMSINSFTEEVSDKVFFPFHFVPSLEEKGLPDEKVITVPYYQTKKFLTLAVQKLYKTNLYGIGIMLHAIADSYSHQQFSGEWSIVNEIHRLRYIVRIRLMSSKFIPAAVRIVIAYLRRFAQWLMSLLAPEIGHARAGTIPDYPYVVWRYRNFEGKYMERSNPDIFFDCGMDIFKLLKRLPIAESDPLDDRVVRETLKQAVYRSGAMKSREKYWRDKIRDLLETHKISIKSERLFDYSSTYWKQLEFEEKRSKMKELKPRDKPYRLKHTFEQFKQSYYYQFHKAAREQRIDILKMLKDVMPRVESSLQETIAKEILTY